MKIDYPEIDWADVRLGDTLLRAWDTGHNRNTYYEFEVNENSLEAGTQSGWVHYLIDRPRPNMPKEPGTLIIAKKVRGVEFPEGIVLRRNKGKDSAYQSVYWISEELVADMGQYGRPRHYDRHPESKIEDWVLAKVVPA